ncbi:TetR family transcriptional regulator [Streptomyces olivaceoviridis]
MSITVTNMFVANKFATNAFAGRRADAFLVER